MRYLLHHTDASYNSVTKKWIVTTDRRVSNPTSIRIATCTFTAAAAASYPSVVYMRSDTLTQLAKIKHTVELKAVDHEDNSNVIAVLEETHTLGVRHEASGPVPRPRAHPVDAYRHIFYGRDHYYGGGGEF